MEFLPIIVSILVAAIVVSILVQCVRVIRQQQVAVVERLGKFRRTLDSGPHLLVPWIDRVRYMIDLREAVVPFPPQGVITEDNLMVNIDSVIYYQVVDPVRAAYEAQNYIQAIEQLTMTTLRNIIGGLDLEQTLTSREEINQKLRAVLDEATGKWGIKVNRVELRSIEPPATIRDAMEKGARAERDKRAAILIAEGQRQSQILSASGEKESAILRAEGAAQSRLAQAQAEAKAIHEVSEAIRGLGNPAQYLVTMRYIESLKEMAGARNSKIVFMPFEASGVRGVSLHDFLLNDGAHFPMER